MTSSLPHPPPAHEGASGGEPWGRGTDKFGPRAQGVTTALPSVAAFVTARLDEWAALAAAASICDDRGADYTQDWAERP